MKQDINLNAELREWFGKQMSMLLKDNPQDIRKHYLDLDEAKKDLIQIVYDRVIRCPIVPNRQQISFVSAEKLCIITQKNDFLSFV